MYYCVVAEHATHILRVIVWNDKVWRMTEPGCVGSRFPRIYNVTKVVKRVGRISNRGHVRNDATLLFIIKI